MTEATDKQLAGERTRFEAWFKIAYPIFDREGRADTDYLKLDYRDFESMKRILRHLLIGKIFPVKVERLDFSFLDASTFGYS